MIKDSKKYNVLITSPSLDSRVNVSGVATVVRNIVNLKNLDNGFDSFNHVLVIIGKPDHLRRNISWFFSQFSAVISFIIALFKCRPKIIHINGPISFLATIRDFVLLAISRLYSRNVIYHVHGGVCLHQPPISRMYRFFLRKLFCIPKVIVVLGSTESESISRLYNVSSSRIKLLPNAVFVPERLDNRVFAPRLNVLFVGRLSEEKGLNVLCDAFERYTSLDLNISLRVFGAGPLESGVTSSLTRSLGERFEFGGVATASEVSNQYKWADVLVLPSLYGEGLPMVILEAMATGVVPITTDDGSITDVVQNLVNGIIVEKGCSESLVRAFALALELKNTGGLQEMSARAHNKVLARNSLSPFSSALDDIYNQAMF